MPRKKTKKNVRHVECVPVIKLPLFYKLEPLQCSHKCSSIRRGRGFFFFFLIPQFTWVKFLFANWLRHRSVKQITARCYCGKTSLCKNCDKTNQNHERLAKHTATNMYTRAKWEAVGPLITTLVLMLIPHISLSRHSFPLEHQSGLCFHFSSVCLRGIFVLCAVHQVPWFQKHVHPVYRSSRLCCVLLSFSHGAQKLQFGKVLFIFFME